MIPQKNANGEVRVARGSYFKGQFLPLSEGNGSVISRNPGDLGQGELEFPFLYEHVGEAVAAARQAYRSWRRIPASDRTHALRRYRDFLEKRGNELVHSITWEIGKPLWDSRAELAETLQIIDECLNAGTATQETVEVKNASEHGAGFSRLFPRGVIVVIPPASQPLTLSHSYLIPALIHGNTVVLKGASQCPYSNQILAEIAHDAGLPAGVFNLLHGDWEMTRRLVGHAEVDGVFFCGGYEVAARIQKQILNDYWKIGIFDTGKKNGIVVWEDCHYEKAIHESLFSTLTTSGQRFDSGDRILIHEKLFDRFVEDFHQLAKKCRVGYGGVEGPEAPFMGPLIDEEALEHYLRYQGIAVREGCEEIMRGKPLEREKRGYYVSPSIHYVPKLENKSIYQKNEIFGPNVAVFKVKDLEETVEILNSTQFGLVTSVYTASASHFQRLLEDLRMGVVNWNLPTTCLSRSLPLGGVKASGNARPLGSHAVHQCTYPVSSLEGSAKEEFRGLPAELPRLP